MIGACSICHLGEYLQNLISFGHKRYCPLIGSDTPLWHARGQSEVSVLCMCEVEGECVGDFETEFGFQQQKLKCWGVKVLEVLPEALLKSGMFFRQLLFSKI